jgi:hypothetical protein
VVPYRWRASVSPIAGITCLLVVFAVCMNYIFWWVKLSLAASLILKVCYNKSWNFCAIYSYIHTYIHTYTYMMSYILLIHVYTFLQEEVKKNQTWQTCMHTLTAFFSSSSIFEDIVPWPINQTHIAWLKKKHDLRESADGKTTSTVIIY